MSGREKQQAASRIARELPGGADHSPTRAVSPTLEAPRKRTLERRPSGLVVPTDG